MSQEFRGDKEFNGPEMVLHKQESQRDNICKQLLQLSTKQCNEYFVEDSKFLARGHLAPAADFNFLLDKRATYSMLNVAPQWQQINGGTWKSVEMGVRAQSTGNKKRSFDVFTGTLGVMQMTDARGVRRDVYLDAKNKRLAVPLLFYKVVVLRGTTTQPDRGVVFVSVNDPNASDADVRAALHAANCPDVADRMEWPGALFASDGQRENRYTPKYRARGFLFACEVQAFIRSIPALSREVRNKFYPLLSEKADVDSTTVQPTPVTTTLRPQRVASTNQPGPAIKRRKTQRRG